LSEIIKNSSEYIIIFWINRIPYNIQWEGKHPIIVNNNRSKIDTLPPVGELAELTITSYLAYLAREEKVKKIHFFLIQYIAESCYKTSMWTYFGRVRVKDIIVVILLVYDKRKKACDWEVTWHDVIGLE